MTRRLPQLCALVAAAAALGLSACGGSKKDAGGAPSRSEAEAAITAKYTKLLQPVTKVSCPSDIPSAENATFRCTATFNSGDVIPIEGTIGEKGAVTYERLGLLTRRLETIISASASKPKGLGRGKHVDVKCPRTRALKEGDVFACTLTVAGQRPRTVYVVQQRFGRIRITLRKPTGA